jgi:hypothetical protein
MTKDQPAFDQIAAQMTAPAQQLEHCEHEWCCPAYWYPHLNEDELALQYTLAKRPCGHKGKECPKGHDTRSRPHTPAPEHKKRIKNIQRNEEGNLTMTFDYDQLTEHDTAIARAATNATLKTIAEKLDKKEQMFDDGELYFMSEDVNAILESLRTEQGKKGGD